MKRYILAICLTFCTVLLWAQKPEVALSNIEANTVLSLPNGLRIQVVKTSEYQYFTYRFTADVSNVGEGKYSGIKQIVADVTGCDFLPNDIIVKKMVSHNHALDSLFEFMADVIYGKKYANFVEYRDAKLQQLENGDMQFLLQNIASAAVGENVPTKESLKAIDKNVVESYVKQCFSPERCILTIVADTDPQTVLESAQKHFGKAVKTQPSTQPDNKLLPACDFIYYLESDIPNVVVGYSNFFPLVKNQKNFLLGNVAYKIMFLDNSDEAYRKTSIKSDCYNFSTQMSVDNFERFQNMFLAPLNQGFNFAEITEKAKQRVGDDFDRMMMRPEYAAEIASYLLLYKLPKNYFTIYKQQLAALNNTEITDFFNQMKKNGRSVMTVSGKRELLHCPLFTAAKQRDVVFINQNIETLRKIPRGFGEQSIIDNYLTKTGLNNPPKNLIEGFSSTFKFNGADTYNCVGKIFRKYPNMYRMQNFVVHTADSLILHFVEMYNGKQGYDSTRIYGCIDADSIRNRQLAQKAAFPIESYYNQLNISARFVCDYQLDTAGFYALEILDPLGGHYRDYFSINDGIKQKTEIFSKSGAVDTRIEYIYQPLGNYLLPKTITEYQSNVIIETTFNDFITNENLKTTDFERYSPVVEKKKKH